MCKGRLRVRYVILFIDDETQPTNKATQTGEDPDVGLLLGKLDLVEEGGQNILYNSI